MKSITIHGLDDSLDDKIRSKADSAGQSLNKTIKRLLREALGLVEQPPDRKLDFQDLFGSWSQVDLEAFGRATGDFETVDPEDWK